MNLSPQAIIIIAAVFGGGFLLMIPVFIMQNNRKKKEEALKSQNRDKAVLQLYADAPVIDGIKVKEMPHTRGEYMQYTVALAPGRHNILAKYTSSEPSLGKNVNYKTPQPISSDIDLEGGHEYSLAIYFYSPDERHNYYKGDVPEHVFSQTLEITGGFGGHTRAYIICYKDK